MAVDAVLRLKGSSNLDYIQLIKKTGGSIKDSYLADGFILEKSISVGCPRRIENAKFSINFIFSNLKFTRKGSFVPTLLWITIKSRSMVLE